MRPRDLRLVVLHVSSRCDQACRHCSVWEPKERTHGELDVSERMARLREARELGARGVLFTGGEPLLCDHIETLVRGARSFSLRVQIATNGLGLGRAAAWLSLVDEVYVSLEGPEDIHDRVRGAGMFARLRSSLSIARSVPARPRLIGRTAMTRANAGALVATVASARGLGLDALSFLPLDTTSEAFGGRPDRRVSLAPSPDQVVALNSEVAFLEAAGEAGSFVLEDARKLRAMAERFRPASRRAAISRCNAPEWSSVIEADGSVRPCFFQPTVSSARGGGLREVRASADYAAALARLGPGNGICAACVCPKYVGTPLGGMAERVAAALSRMVLVREANPA